MPRIHLTRVRSSMSLSVVDPSMPTDPKLGKIANDVLDMRERELITKADLEAMKANVVK